MTDNDIKTKEKRLTLNKSRTLSLNKNTDISQNTSSDVTTRNNTIIEVKGSIVDKIANTNEQQISDELIDKINILKKASSDKNINTLKISTLSELMAINRGNNKEVINTPTTSIIEKASDASIQTGEVSEIIPSQTNNSDILEKNIERDNVDDKNTDSKVVKKTVASNKIVEEDKQQDKVFEVKPAIKNKSVEIKKLKKSDIFTMLDRDEGNVPTKMRSLASLKRAQEKAKRKNIQISTKPEKVYREVILSETVTVGDLANKMTERSTDVIGELMKLGVMANSSQVIDYDTASLIVETFGHTCKLVQESDVENILIEEDDIKLLKPRAPVVTVMGHVDHGKTSLLDALKSTDIAASEAGGITQHIGAYMVHLSNNRAITFIDTPGHEAFTEMRIRGTQVTDIVVLVVAADDGIKTQTIEAISHAQAAKVPIIVAVNKIDKVGANIEKVKNELLQHNLISEDLGGDTIIVPVSALKHTNLDKLEEAILLIADLLDLKANYEGKGYGIVIESKMSKYHGPSTTVLVQKGKLKIGDIIVAGSTYGKIRNMYNDKGQLVQEAYPSEPIEIYGINEPPKAGDKINIIDTEKQARDISEYRKRVDVRKKVSLDKAPDLNALFKRANNESNIKDLFIIIKSDTQGSIEVIQNSILSLSNEEVHIKIIHKGVGDINESDINLADTSNALIVGFNVKTNSNAIISATANQTNIKHYSIIYNLIDDIKDLVSGMISPIIREQYTGSAEVRQIFNITKVGKIAGSYVTNGILKRGSYAKLLRDDKVIYEGKLRTLKRFKDDVSEVKENFECGIALEGYDNIQVGDVIQAFDKIEERRKL